MIFKYQLVCWFLSGSARRIRSVGSIVGFADQSHLIRHFKSVFGLAH